MAGALVGGSWGEAEEDSECPDHPSLCLSHLPLSETLVHSQIQGVGGCTVPFQGTRSIRACWVCPVPSLLITQVAPPQLPTSPTQEESFPQTETEGMESL